VTPTIASYKPRVTHVPKPAGYPTDAQIAEQEAAVMAQASSTGGGMQKIRDALRVRSDSEVNAVVPGRAANPENVRRVEAIIPRAKFDFLFPVRHLNYTYENYLKAIAKFPSYCDTYTDGRNSDAICRKLLAVSFAHFTQETGANWSTLTPATAPTNADYPSHHNPVLDTMPQNEVIPLWRQALWFLREVGYLEGGGRGAYQNCYNGAGTIFSIFYPCGQNASGQFLDYFGRGSKQLSWNYNYGPFSKALYGDVNVLLDDPGRVADTWLNFSSAIWFAIMPRAPKPPMTWVVDGTWVPSSADISANMKPGLGATTFIINGGIECGKGAETQQSTNRINAYREIARELGVPIPADEPLGCGNMMGFPVGSSATTQTYLDRVWNGIGCQLVTYETPFNIAAAGDYKACVDYWFRGQVIYNGQIVINNAPQ
jgi:chitodextrinase